MCWIKGNTLTQYNRLDINGFFLFYVSLEMNAIETLNYMIVTIIATIGFLVSIILYVNNRDRALSARLLAGILLCISLFAINYALVGTSFFVKYPHAWRIPAFFSGLMPPMLYLYVQSILNQQFKLRSRDYFLVIPAIIYTINFLPFYLLSTEDKRELIVKMLVNKQLAAQEIDGQFPLGWGILIRLGIGLLFCGLALVKIRKSKVALIIMGDKGTQNHEIYAWLYYLTYCVLFSFALLVLWFVLELSKVFELYAAISLTAAGCISLICGYLLIKPNILYGLKGWNIQPSLSAEEAIEDRLHKIDISNHPKTSFFTAEMRMEIKSRLENHFKNNKPFLAAGYKIKDLSGQLNIPIYLISTFINQEYGKNFNELVNEYRVDYVADILKQSPDSQNFTLEAIAQSAGFNSRSTFIAAVKKKSGMTPSSYFSMNIT
jgi:AraC-like DNA-binding protein